MIPNIYILLHQIDTNLIAYWHTMANMSTQSLQKKCAYYSKKKNET